MAAVYLFLMSLIVLCFAMYVYENEKNMLQFKLECMEDIKELNKTTNLTREDFVLVWQRIDNLTLKLNEALETITVLKDSSKKERTMTCPDEWIMRELNCYIFIKSPKTWEQAADDCTSKQAKLIKISDSGMNSWVASQMRGHGISILWIGLNDRLREGDYVWHGDSSKLTYGSWHRREPNDYRGEEDCVTSEGILWNDIPCSHHHPYACEKKTILQ